MGLIRQLSSVQRVYTAKRCSWTVQKSVYLHGSLATTFPTNTTLRMSIANRASPIDYCTWLAAPHKHYYNEIICSLPTVRARQIRLPSGASRKCECQRKKKLRWPHHSNNQEAFWSIYCQLTSNIIIYIPHTFPAFPIRNLSINQKVREKQNDHCY